MAKRLKLNNSITIEQLRDDFIASCRARNLSSYTVDNYTRNTKYFIEWINNSNILLEDITNKTLIEYTKYLQTHTNRNGTSINTILRNCKVWFEWLYQEEYIEQPIKVRYLKVDKKPKDIYSDEDIRKLIAKPSNNCTLAEYRNYCIIRVFIGTGIRRTTLINLKLEDILWEERLIRLTITKARKTQYVPLTVSVAKAIKDWLKYRPNSDTNYLFLTEQGTQLQADNLTNSIYDYCKKRGCKITSIHAFRHYFSQSYIESGRNIYHLSKMLGHSNISVTENYLRSIKIDKLFDMEQFDLLANLQ